MRSVRAGALSILLLLAFQGTPAGGYYLGSTANFSQAFLESDYTNNRAWVSFRLARDKGRTPRHCSLAPKEFSPQPGGKGAALAPST